MVRLPAGYVLFVIVGSCTSAHERAELQARQGNQALQAGDYKTAIGLFDQAVQAEDREDAYLGRAEALVKTGDEIKAFESLARCQSEDCDEKRKSLTQILKTQAAGSFSDDAGFKRFLRIEELIGVSKRCALITAIASTSDGDAARHTLVRAAVQTEVDRLAGLLHDIDPRAPRLSYARSNGAELADVTDCHEVDAAQGRMTRSLGTIASYAVKRGGLADVDGDRIEKAFDWGLFSAKLALFTHSPASADAAADKPLRSASDLRAYLDTMTAAGKSPECALFTAILRAERLPRAQRAALKGPLMAALAPLAPKNGEKVEFKVGGRKTMPMASLASGAQSCRELDDLFAELSRGAARIAEAMAAIGDDGSSGENAVALDRTAYVYEALRTRLEHPMSKADVQAAEADYAQYRRSHAHARGDD